MGIPVIACHCPVCKSDNSKNKRLRAAGIIEINHKTLLIDCGPDFRQQALQAGINSIDGVLFTHAHYDHTSSVDELRVFYMHSKQAVPCLLSKETAYDLISRFHYIFEQKNSEKRLKPKMRLVELENDRGEVLFETIPFRYFTYEQAGMKVSGYRLGNFAYVTDIKHYPESIFEDLKGVEILVLSALRHSSSYLHLTVDEAVDFARKAGAKQTWLTHISHDLDHDKTNDYLPPEVRMAYDGLQINISL